MPPQIAWLFELLARGGPIVAVLLGMSILSLSIVLVKWRQFARARLRRLGGCEAALRDAQGGDRAAALARLDADPHPAARVLEAALADGPEDPALRREEVARVGQAQLGALESSFRGLETVASLAPLLGLLGTVIGMIRAFMQLETARGPVEPALLAGGIWEALLTTAVGLAVAIPTSAALAWLESEVDRVRRAMGDLATRALSSRPEPPQVAALPQRDPIAV
ncbi:MAG: MotA/TolQ/ExbB proton channel family protein [Proteobacteria bacterium]|nr:MotA/TolQ/ExbB proton channel family protein [Pseudomonadota bacterium]